MSTSNRRQYVISKYRLEAISDIESIGPGPIMDPATFQRFVDGDPSGNLKYLDWMLFMAGGGQTVMRQALALWKGNGLNDALSLRNLAHDDYVAEQMAGHVDEVSGVKHAPVSALEAEKRWSAYEPEALHEFIMGDQDISAYGGFGFYRHWPGKDGYYAKIVEAVQLWHKSQSKLKARNSANKDGRIGNIDLDIYRGWSLTSFSQEDAVYGRFSALTEALTCVRVDVILENIRAENIYEDIYLKAVCPLTVGASIKFGIPRWCTANRSDFERACASEYQTSYSWKNYTGRGPLVYLTFKSSSQYSVLNSVASLALHLEPGTLSILRQRSKDTLANLPVYDADNTAPQAHYSDIVRALTASHVRELNATTSDLGSKLQASLDKAIDAIALWYESFDMSTLEVDPLFNVAKKNG